jgi:hypothetical protein
MSGRQRNIFNVVVNKSVLKVMNKMYPESSTSRHQYVVKTVQCTTPYVPPRSRQNFKLFQDTYILTSLYLNLLNTS